MFRPRSFSVLLALAIPVAAAFVPVSAFADTPPAAAAPTTHVAARFQRYLLAPDGRVMGILLSDGSFVRTSHSMAKNVPGIRAGEVLQIDGVAKQTPTGTAYMRAVVKQGNVVISDASQPREHHAKGEHRKGQHPHAALTPVSSTARVAAILSTPRGRVTALVLDDGTTATGRELGTLGLKVGDSITVAGNGGTYALGKALRITKVTLPNGTTRDITYPPHHHRHHAATQNPA